MFGVNEFSANDEVKSQSKILLCNDDSLYQLACANDLFLIGGFDQAQLNYVGTLLLSLEHTSPDLTHFRRCCLLLTVTHLQEPL